MPHVREALPGVTTYIVGSNVPGNVRALAADDFVVTGYVPDVTPYFTGCRVSIAPLRYGAGVKGKINLAMSYGLPVVATTPSIEGMSLVPERDVLVADDARAFADAIVRLYHDEALWNQLAAGGRDKHPHLFFARCRAQHDHAADRIREGQRHGVLAAPGVGLGHAIRRLLSRLIPASEATRSPFLDPRRAHATAGLSLRSK